jgi:negative regulator of genetic competence, sporulation and motility
MAVDYAERAAQCRRLAAQYTTRVEHWAHFNEMAETWEMLHRHQQEKIKRQEELKEQEELKQKEELKHQQEKSRLQTIALADQFRDVLSLSNTAPNTPAQADFNEKAA